MDSLTLDTNVYVSALEFGGIGARLLELARARAIRIDTSNAILDELVTVLRDDFHWSTARNALEHSIARNGLVQQRLHFAPQLLVLAARFFQERAPPRCGKLRRGLV